MAPIAQLVVAVRDRIAARDEHMVEQHDERRDAPQTVQLCNSGPHPLHQGGT